MLHALCFLASFLCAVDGAVRMRTETETNANAICVGGLLLLCLIITLDYITERLQARRKRRLAPPQQPRNTFGKPSTNQRA